MRAVTRAVVTVALALGLAPAALATAPPKRAPVPATPSLAALQAIFHLDAAQPRNRDRARSCAKGAKRSTVRASGSSATANLARKAVVACEQPPRSELVLPALKHAAAIVRALVG